MREVSEPICGSEVEAELVQTTADPLMGVRLTKSGGSIYLEGCFPHGSYLFLLRFSPGKKVDYKLLRLMVSSDAIHPEYIEEANRLRGDWKFENDGTTQTHGQPYAGWQDVVFVLQPGARNQLLAMQENWSVSKYIVVLRVEMQNATGLASSHDSPVSCSDYVEKLSDLLKRLEYGDQNEAVIKRLGELTTQMLWYADGNPVAGLLGERDSARTLGQLIADMLHGMRDLCAQTVPVPEPPHPMQLIKTSVPPSFSAKTMTLNLLRRGGQQ